MVALTDKPLLCEHAKRNGHKLICGKYNVDVYRADNRMEYCRNCPLFRIRR